MAKPKAPLYEKPSNLVQKDVHGRVRHAWAREANVAKADENCKGVWKPPPDKYVNKTPGTGLAGAVQRANQQANARARSAGAKPHIRDVEPNGVGPAHRVGRHHQANLQQMRELQKRKMDEPRPATVPAMNVKQPYHVQQYFDRAAHHGEFAKDARMDKAKRDMDTLRQPDDRTQRLGHTQHRTVQDVECRVDDVWGVMQADRGQKKGQLTGHSYIDKAVQNPSRIYVGNVPVEASSGELKKACGLMDADTLLCDPAKCDPSSSSFSSSSLESCLFVPISRSFPTQLTRAFCITWLHCFYRNRAEGVGNVFWIERKLKDCCAIIFVPNKKTADRIVKVSAGKHCTSVQSC